MKKIKQSFFYIEYKIQFILFIILLILLSVCSSKFYFRIDTTGQKAYSLSGYTYEMLDNLTGAVTVTWFKSEHLESFFPSLKYLADVIYEYQNYSGSKFIFNKKNISELSEEAIKKIDIIPRQIKSQSASTETLYTVYSGLMIEYNGKTRIIPFVDDIDILEYDIARFIYAMHDASAETENEKKISVIVPPNSLETDYRYILPWLEYAGITAEVLTLPIENISEDQPLLVIGSDYIDFSTAAAIDVFLQKHGKAVFFVSGNTVDVKGNWKAAPKIKDFLLDVLAHNGFYINNDLILDSSNFRITMNSVDNSGIKMINYPFWIQLRYEGIAKNNPLFSGIFTGYKYLQTFWPSSLSFDETKKIDPIAFTTSHSFKMMEKYDTDPFNNQLSLFSTAEKKAEAIITERILPSPVIVISDEYMLSTAIDYTGSSVNLDFMINCIEHLFGLDELLVLKNKQHTALPFKTFTDQDEFNFIINSARIISLIVLPFVILCAGIYSFIRGRKHQ